MQDTNKEPTISQIGVMVEGAIRDNNPELQDLLRSKLTYLKDHFEAMFKYECAPRELTAYGHCIALLKVLDTAASGPAEESNPTVSLVRNFKAPNSLKGLDARLFGLCRFAALIIKRYANSDRSAAQWLVNWHLCNSENGDVLTKLAWPAEFFVDHTQGSLSLEESKL